MDRFDLPCSVRRTAAIFLATLLGLLSPARASAETVSEMQWYLRALHVPEAQRITRGEGVIVAVIDSGVDASHPDLAGAVLPGSTLVGNKIESGQNDVVGHGTKMAGVIAARGGAGPNHALGIAPGARILPIAIPDKSGSLVEPLRFAVDHGARVINISLSRPKEEGLSAPEVAAFAYAQAQNVVVVVCSGNVQESPTNSIAELPGLVVVSGVLRNGSAWNGSLQGSFVALSAPAVDIVNIGARRVHKTGYSTGTGTSESSAIVSGVAALIRARYPQLDAANVINRLLVSAIDRGSPGRDSEYGFGAVDAYRALTVDAPAVASNPLGVVTEKPRLAPKPVEKDVGTPAMRWAIVIGIAITVVLVGAGALLALILVIAHAAKPRRAPANWR